MDSVSFTLKRRIMEEFYFGFLSEQFQEEGGDDEDEGPIKPFEFLAEMTDEQLIALLANEDVPVIAVALAQLDADKRMAILERMKPDEKGKVLIELGSLQDIPLEAIVEVAGKLKEKASYLPKPVEFSRGGAKEIADLIGEMDADEGEKYMQTLQNENPELYKDVKMLVLTFEDILDKFPDGILRDLCNSVELDALAMAMKGTDQEIVDRVVGNLPQKKQAMYEPVEGPKPKREVDDARKIIVSKAKEMEKEGAFNLADMMGGGEMVE
jgi:flagellar motor switch protein FliG